MRRSFILPVFAFVCVGGCASENLGGGSSIIETTDVPFLIDGDDSGHRILVQLANYSETVVPVLGDDGDAEIQSDGEVLSIRFHPTQTYDDTNGHGAPNQYFLYVGLFAPPLSEDSEGRTIEGGLESRRSIKDQAVRFSGEFRFDSGEPEVRKHLALTPTLIYHGFDQQEFKQIAFNNYGGLTDHPADDLYFDFVEFGWETGWHNVYWGDWWNDEQCAPVPSDPTVPSGWVPFEIDLTAVSARAVAWANNEWRDREAPDEYFNTDEVELWAATLGPEFTTDQGELAFSVRSLNLTFSDR